MYDAEVVVSDCVKPDFTLSEDLVLEALEESMMVELRLNRLDGNVSKVAEVVGGTRD